MPHLLPLLLLPLLGGALPAPQLNLEFGSSYEDMMRSVGRSQEQLGRLLTDNQEQLQRHLHDNSRQMKDIFGGFGRDMNILGSQMGVFGSQLGDEMGSLGSQVGDLGSSLGQHFGDFGSQVGDWGSRINQEVEREVGHLGKEMGDLGDQIGQEMGGFGSQIGQEMGDLGSHMGSLGGSVGGLMDHLHSSMGGRNDPFGQGFMGMFGNVLRPWWQGQNVCQEREVVEEEETSPFPFHVEVHSCEDLEDRYVCSHKRGSRLGQLTVRTTYTCCPGHRLVASGSSRACTELAEMQPLEETLERLGGGGFLGLLVKANLTSLLHNTTVFLPSSQAVQEWLGSSGAEGYAPANTVYRVDEGLLGRRKRSLTVNVMSGPLLEEVVSAHLTPGFLTAADLTDGALLPPSTPEGARIRISRAQCGRREMLLANCAQVTSVDQHAVNGLVHLLDRVMEPAQDSILSVLEADSQFTSFLSALEAKGLAEALGEDGQFTVFAPTDEAFSRLDPRTREKVLGAGSCSAGILEAHVLATGLCSASVQGRIQVHTLQGSHLQLERDEDGNILVEGVKLILTDKIATNGVIHVIDGVILPPASSRTMVEHLQETAAPLLLSLLESVGLQDSLTDSNLTYFLPSEAALSELGEEGRAALASDSKRLSEVLLHHVALGSGHAVAHNDRLETAGGGSLRMATYQHWHSGPGILAQCARVQAIHQVCGGEVVTIDRLLTPPSGDVLATLARDHKQFATLVQLAGLDKDLSSGVYTVLAPTDEAFAALEAAVRENIFQEKEAAERLVKAHILQDYVCCASIPRLSRLLKRSLLGDWVPLRRAARGGIFAGTVPLARCDLAAENGVVHSLSSLLTGSTGQQPRQRTRDGFWPF